MFASVHASPDRRVPGPMNLHLHSGWVAFDDSRFQQLGVRKFRSRCRRRQFQFHGRGIEASRIPSKLANLPNFVSLSNPRARGRKWTKGWIGGRRISMPSSSAIRSIFHESLLSLARELQQPPNVPPYPWPGIEVKTLQFRFPVGNSQS